MRKQAFTLLEIMVVIVILGILSALALPRYLKMVEIRRAEAAKQNLKLIVSAMEYFTYNRIPWPEACDVGQCDIDGINQGFELDIHDENFNYYFGFSMDASGDAVWGLVAFSKNISYVLWMHHTQGFEMMKCGGPDCSLIGMQSDEWVGFD